MSPNNGRSGEENFPDDLIHLSVGHQACDDSAAYQLLIFSELVGVGTHLEGFRRQKYPRVFSLCAKGKEGENKRFRMVWSKAVLV